MHRVQAAMLASGLLGACSGHSAVECTTSSDCLQNGVPGSCVDSPTSTRRWCAFGDADCQGSDLRWGILAGDGLASMCLEGWDGGIADASLDGAQSLPDAEPADASGAIDAATPDGAPPPVSPVVSGQAADLVLGQATFSGTSTNAGGENGTSMAGPAGVASDGTRVWVADHGNVRVLQWNSLPVVNQQAASIVVGQASPLSHVDGLSQSLLGTTGFAPWAFPIHVSCAAGKLVVSDPFNNRVLIWTSIPGTTGAAANLVLGQTSFTTQGSGTGMDRLNAPTGVWTDGVRVIVADTGNSRVLIWTSFPTTNGQAASVALGGATAGPPTASSMSGPADVWSDGTRLVVADMFNNRVLLWGSIPVISDADADLVLGQGDFASLSPNAGSPSTNAIGFDGPAGVYGLGESLFVADSLNHRVVVFTPIPTTNAEAADAVLGQSDLMSGGDPGATANASRMSQPLGVTALGTHLFVTDGTWNRTLRFALTP